MKYIIQKSSTPDWWVVTDTENLVVLEFKEHEYNETQRATMLEDSNLTVLQLARVMREIGDWIAQNHMEKAF